MGRTKNFDVSFAGKRNIEVFRLAGDARSLNRAILGVVTDEVPYHFLHLENLVESDMYFLR